MASFESFGNKLETFAKGLPKVYDSLSIEALAQIRAGMLDRVFNNSKDTNGNPIGNYKSEQYKKRRTKKGLQVGRVDLIFTGNLQKGSREIGRENGQNVLRFSDNFSKNKARWNEERFKGSTSTIFASSNEETKQAIDIIDEGISEYINSIF